MMFKISNIALIIDTVICFFSPFFKIIHRMGFFDFIHFTSPADLFTTRAMQVKAHLRKRDVLNYVYSRPYEFSSLFLFSTYVLLNIHYNILYIYELYQLSIIFVRMYSTRFLA